MPHRTTFRLLIFILFVCGVMLCSIIGMLIVIYKQSSVYNDLASRYYELDEKHLSTMAMLWDVRYLKAKETFAMEVRISRMQPKNPASVRQLKLAVDAYRDFVVKYPDARTYNRLVPIKRDK